MAEYNVKINVKTDTGYDQLYPKSKSDIIDFDKTSSNLSSTNVEAAIKEVNTKTNTNKTNIGTLTSLTTDSKTNLVAAVNEVDSHANTAQSTANNASSAASTAQSTANTANSTANTLKNSIIDSLSTIKSNTTSGKIAGALAVKDLASTYWSSLTMDGSVSLLSNNINHIKKSGSVVQINVNFKNIYQWDAGRGLYVGKVPDGYRPSSEISKFGITNSGISYNLSVYVDGSINLWARSTLNANTEFYENIVYII